MLTNIWTWKLPHVDMLDNGSARAISPTAVTLDPPQLNVEKEKEKEGSYGHGKMSGTPVYPSPLIW